MPGVVSAKKPIKVKPPTTSAMAPFQKPSEAAGLLDALRTEPKRLKMGKRADIQPSLATGPGRIYPPGRSVNFNVPGPRPAFTFKAPNPARTVSHPVTSLSTMIDNSSTRAVSTPSMHHHTVPAPGGRGYLSREEGARVYKHIREEESAGVKNRRIKHPVRRSAAQREPEYVGETMLKEMDARDAKARQSTSGPSVHKKRRLE